MFIKTPTGEYINTNSIKKIDLLHFDREEYEKETYRVVYYDSNDKRRNLSETIVGEKEARKKLEEMIEKLN